MASTTSCETSRTWAFRCQGRSNTHSTEKLSQHFLYLREALYATVHHHYRTSVLHFHSAQNLKNNFKWIPWCQSNPRQLSGYLILRSYLAAWLSTIHIKDCWQRMSRLLGYFWTSCWSFITPLLCLVIICIGIATRQHDHNHWWWRRRLKMGNEDASFTVAIPYVAIPLTWLGS